MWIKKFLGMKSGDESAEERLCKIAEGLDEEYAEKNGVLSRRKFFFTIPAIVLAPKLVPKIPTYVIGVDEAIGESVTVYQPICLSAVQIPSSDIILQRYREEIFRQVRQEFVLGKKYL